jgi:hypothetical protein
VVELKELLESLLQKLKKHHSLYEQNETAVRDQIVNPILRGLGWDTEDPDKVRPNVPGEEGTPDYTLRKGEKEILFVEAKKLSIDVEDDEPIRQLGKYLFGKGTKFGLLTNGAVWVLLRSFQEGVPLAERIVWRADLENEELSSVYRKLQTIAEGNVDHIEELARKVQIVSDVWQSLADEPGELVKGLVPIVKSAIIQVHAGYEIEDPFIEDLLQERIKVIATPREMAGPQSVVDVSEEEHERPTRMRLSGETFDLRNSFEILVNTANWLIKKGKLTRSDAPIAAGPKRYLVNTEPKHRYGDMLQPRKLSNGMVIETHYSTSSCIQYSRRLLQRFGYSPETLAL